MPSYLHARGQFFAYETSPEEGTVSFEGPAFEQFDRLWEQRLKEMVDRWAPYAAPAANQPPRRIAERQR